MLLLMQASPAAAEQKKKSSKSKSVTSKSKSRSKSKSKSKKPKPAPVTPVPAAVAAEPEATPVASKPPPTKPSAAKPSASKVIVKAGTRDPESVDWGTVAPGAQPPPPKKEKVIIETPWSAKLSLGAGVDSNIDLFPDGSDAAALLGTGLYAQALVGKNMRVGFLGSFENNPGKDVPAATESEVFAGYIRDLPRNFQLRVSNLLSYQRERSVFADGTVLLEATTLQTTVANDLTLLGALRAGAFDIEAGALSLFEVHEGKIEESRILGTGAVGALRYTFRDRASLRLRYSYEFSRSKGLSARNLAGGVDSTEDIPLILGVHRIRASTRLRITNGVQIVGRYDRVFATDDFSGFLNSRESVFFAGWVAELPRLTFEGDFQYARRFFTDRIATPDNPNRDTVITGTARLDFWALISRRLGLFALYKYEKASANPTGLLFERHLVLSGIVGRFGSKN
jgi:hypothetical protein